MAPKGRRALRSDTALYAFLYLVAALIWGGFIAAVALLRIDQWGVLAALCLFLFVPAFGLLSVYFSPVHRVYGGIHSILPPVLFLLGFIFSLAMGLLAMGACAVSWVALLPPLGEHERQ